MLACAFTLVAGVNVMIVFQFFSFSCFVTNLIDALPTLSPWLAICEQWVIRRELNLGNRNCCIISSTASATSLQNFFNCRSMCLKGDSTVLSACTCSNGGWVWCKVALLFLWLTCSGKQDHICRYCCYHTRLGSAISVRPSALCVTSECSCHWAAARSRIY